MATSKKQINELENAIVILEERLEKLEEEHVMMKQMLSMQNALIDNLQMMLKMMSVKQGYQVGYVHLGGKQEHENQQTSATTNKNDNDDSNKETIKTNKNGGHKNLGMKTSLKERMSRVV